MLVQQSRATPIRQLFSNTDALRWCESAPLNPMMAESYDGGDIWAPGIGLK